NGIFGLLKEFDGEYTRLPGSGRRSRDQRQPGPKPAIFEVDFSDGSVEHGELARRLEPQPLVEAMSVRGRLQDRQLPARLEHFWAGQGGHGRADSSLPVRLPSDDTINAADFPAAKGFSGGYRLAIPIADQQRHRTTRGEESGAGPLIKAHHGGVGWL